MTSSPTPDSTCYDCATNQTRLDTLDSEYVTLCEAIDALRTRLADLETRTTGLTTALGGLALSSTVHHHSTRLHALEAAQRCEHRTMHATFNEHQARLEALEAWHKQIEQRASLPLPGAGQMRDAYNPENDAAKVSYWDMMLLGMIERVNERLGLPIGGE
jgi:hypothetical protein